MALARAIVFNIYSEVDPAAGCESCAICLNVYYSY